jgi:hypothetical protein
MTMPLWTPLESRVSQTTLHAFSFWLSSRTGKSLIGYDELHEFSVGDPAMFRSALRDFTKISGERGKGHRPSSTRLRAGALLSRRTSRLCRLPGYATTSKPDPHWAAAQAAGRRAFPDTGIPRRKSGKG